MDMPVQQTAPTVNPQLLFAKLTGSLLRRWRKSQGLSQKDMAHAIGTQQSGIHKLECGKYEINVGQLYAISVVLGMRPSEILSQVEKLIDGLGDANVMFAVENGFGVKLTK